MLLVYTGEGKGKSSATIGQSIRALGRNLKVAFAQFMKKDGHAGEQVVLRALLKDDFFAGGIGFFRKQDEFPEHRQAALAVLDWARSRLPGLDLLALDEALYALGAGLITRDELLEIIEKCRRNGCHLVLSGRGVPDWLAEKADLITEMRMVKHPYTAGTKAQEGIEY